MLQLVFGLVQIKYLSFIGSKFFEQQHVLN
jgi:hypothetical protein